MITGKFGFAGFFVAGSLDKTYKVLKTLQVLSLIY